MSSGASVSQTLAAASIKVMDALFGFLARSDAEWTKRELLGRTWRRDWAMRKFQEKTRNPRYFPGSGKKSRNQENFSDWMLWAGPRRFIPWGLGRAIAKKAGHTPHTPKKQKGRRYATLNSSAPRNEIEHINSC